MLTHSLTMNELLNSLLEYSKRQKSVKVAVTFHFETYFMYKYIIMAHYYKLSILLPCCAKVPAQLYLKQMFCWEHKNQLQ